VRRFVFRLWLLLAGAALACSPAAEPVRAPAASESASGFEGPAHAVEVTGQNLELTLPDSAGWRHDGRQKHSWLARHAATGSSLLVRSWRAEKSARPEDCERELRLWRPELPSLSQEERFESRQLSLDGGYTAQASSGARAVPQGVVSGFAQLFGSDGRSCIGLIFSTAAQGDAAARAVGERLALVSRLVFERARHIGIETRVVVPRR